MGDGVSAVADGTNVVVTVTSGSAGGAFGNLDGGQPDSNYGGINSIDAGGVSG